MQTNEIKKILVPFDFSKIAEVALDEAGALAVLFKAELFIIHVVEQSNYSFLVPKELPPADTDANEFENVIRGNLEKVGENIKNKYKLNCHVHIATGHIHNSIMDYAKKMNVDLIVMGTHGARGYKEVFAGSNTQRLVDLSDIPVLTFLNNLSKTGFRNILIPIDNSTHSREKVNLAMEFARMYKAGLHILGLPDSDDEQDLNKFKVKIKSVESLVKNERLEYKTTIVHEKSLARAALNYASAQQCDLIVINTGHESKIPGMFTQQIVNHSTIPVLNIRHTEESYSIETPGFGI